MKLQIILRTNLCCCVESAPPLLLLLLPPLLLRFVFNNNNDDDDGDDDDDDDYDDPLWSTAVLDSPKCVAFHYSLCCYIVQRMSQRAYPGALGVFSKFCFLCYAPNIAALAMVRI